MIGRTCIVPVQLTKEPRQRLRGNTVLDPQPRGTQLLPHPLHLLPQHPRRQLPRRTILRTLFTRALANEPPTLANEPPTLPDEHSALAPQQPPNNK